MPGELPFGYITWFLYALILSIKFGILYSPDIGIVSDLTAAEKIGSGFCKTALALSSFVFLLLVSTHHDALPGSSRSDFINTIAGTVTFDILDTVNFIDVLYIQESKIMINYYVKIAIIVVSSINLMMPTILLLTLSKTYFGKTRFIYRFEYIYNFLYLIIVNLPMLIIRSITIRHSEGVVSVFIIKNSFSVIFAIKKVFDYYIYKHPNVMQETINLQTVPSSI